MLRLQYDTTLDEMEEVYRQYHRAKVGPPFRRLAGLVLALVAMLAIPPVGPLRDFMSGEFKAFLLICVLAGTVILTASVVVAWFGLRAVIRPLHAQSAARRAVRIPVTVRIDEADISADYIIGGQPRPWSAVTGFLETRDHAIIGLRGHDFAFVFVPKRSLTPAELANLRDIVVARQSATAS